MQFDLMGSKRHNKRFRDESRVRYKKSLGPPFHQKAADSVNYATEEWVLGETA